MVKINIQNKEFFVGKLKGKHLRKMAKLGDDDNLKMFEIILDVDEAFVDEMTMDEINLITEAMQEENPSMKPAK